MSRTGWGLNALPLTYGLVFGALPVRGDLLPPRPWDAAVDSFLGCEGGWGEKSGGSLWEGRGKGGEDWLVS